ncbi:MAG: hypothetical protein GC168_21475 [Candidatus Hydrogenedens sp.]|nr:hypothetical protein [Candidatus Hydrogenedens sp.]
MEKIKKDFDCIALKRAAALRLHEATKNMSRDEVLRFWQERNAAFRQKYPKMRVQHQDSPPNP